LLVGETAEARTGNNFAEAAAADLIVLSEHQRREGMAEGAWKASHKFDLYRQDLLRNAEFQRDWQGLKRHFTVQKFQDSRRIIRRSPVAERNWQRPTHPELEVSRERFQVAFDFFCWKWFLYGMRGDEPLVEKLTCTLTPFARNKVTHPHFASLPR
jgi:pterin-4a-carbinolamine dehydratase